MTATRYASMGYRFQPALMTLALYLSAAALGVEKWRAALDIGIDESFLRALVHVELALAPLCFFLPAFKGRAEALNGALNAVACFAALSAALFSFTFMSATRLPLETLGLCAAAWLAASGVVAAGSGLEGRFGGPWRTRLKVLWLALTAFPVLWHYFALEYGGKTLLHLRAISPNWLLAAYPDADYAKLEYWPLLAIGGAGWLASLILAPKVSA